MALDDGSRADSQNLRGHGRHEGFKIALDEGSRADAQNLRGP
jgi:hypothetical protein